MELLKLSANVNECKPLPTTTYFHTLNICLLLTMPVCPSSSWITGTWNQGLTLVHCLAQRKRFLWDRGCT